MSGQIEVFLNLGDCDVSVWIRGPRVDNASDRAKLDFTQTVTQAAQSFVSAVPGEREEQRDSVYGISGLLRAAK